MQFRAGIWLKNDERDFILIEFNLINRRQYKKSLIADLQLRYKILCQQLLKFFSDVFLGIGIYERVHFRSHILGILEIKTIAVICFCVPTQGLEFFQSRFHGADVHSRSSHIAQNICFRQT